LWGLRISGASKHELPLSRVFLRKAEVHVRFVCDGMVVSIKVILFHVGYRATGVVMIVHAGRIGTYPAAPA
jgi:hypothetical protein